MPAPQPLYERIEKRLRARADAADDGDPFPSEQQLAREFGVARMTVRQALAGLERDGRLERIPGRGTFVRAAAAVRPVGTLLSFHDQMVAAGRTPRSRLVEAGVRPATGDEADALLVGGLAAAAGSAAAAAVVVVGITRVRLADDVPVAVERAAFPASLTALLDADLESGSLHQALRRLGRRPTLGSSVLTARIAGADAVALGVGPGTPMLVETRTIVDQDGTPLEHTVSAYVAERYALKVDFTVAAGRA